MSGKFYTDMTGAFPIMSLEGEKYYFVAYNYDTSAIFEIPITDLRDETIIKALTEVFEELAEKGYTPTFNVTDNQATTPIKAFLKKTVAIGNLWSHQTTESTQQNGPSRRLGITSSVVSPQQTPIGHCDFGIN